MSSTSTSLLQSQFGRQFTGRCRRHADFLVYIVDKLGRSDVKAKITNLTWLCGRFACIYYYQVTTSKYQISGVETSTCDKTGLLGHRLG